MAVPLETFVHYIRRVDIDKMAADQVITQAEAEYFKHGDPWPGPENADKVETHPDWENLYDAWRVRVPIWAV